jgi:hypothetical protein
MSLLLSMNSLPGIITDLTAAWISIIVDLRISCSGEDCLKRLSSVSESEFLAGELMIHSSSPKQKVMRNYFTTAQNSCALKIIKYHLVIILTETDLQRKHTRISEIREIVGIYEIDIEDIKYSPLKIKVKQILNASGDCYIGFANLTIKGKGCLDFYRSMHPQKTKEDALRDAVDGFFAFLSDESEIKEVKNW